MTELVILVPLMIPLIMIVCLLDGIQTEIRHLRWTVEEQAEWKEERKSGYELLRSTKQTDNR